MKSPISLKAYLSLHFCTVAVLPIITIAVLVWFFVMPAIQTRIGIRHQAMARSVAGQISAHLKGGERQLIALAEYLQSEGRNPEKALIGLLDAQCGKGELFEALFIADNEDMIIQTVGLAKERRWRRADLMGLDLSGRKFIQTTRALLKEAAWSETFLSTVGSHMAVALIVPMAGGFITGEITLENLSEVISHLPGKSELRTLVIDGQGMIVADSEKLRFGQVFNVTFHPAEGIVSSGSFSSNSFELDGQRMLGTLLEMDDPGWKVLVAQPSKNVFKPIRDTFLLIAIGFAIALTLAISISWFQASNLSNLFQAYAERAQSIAKGQYTLDWPQARAREFDQLGQGLQRMAQQISQREKALVENEERLQDLVSNVPGVVYQFTADPNVFTSVVRDKSIELLGLDSEPEKFFDDFVACLPEEDQPRFITSVKEAVESVTPWHYEGRFIRPSGGEIWLDCYSIPKRAGDKIVFYGILTDITQRRELESSLRFSQFIFEKATIAIFILGENGEFLNVNEEVCRYLGYSREELSHMTVFDVDTVFTAEGWGAFMADLRSHGVKTIETWNRHKNGKVFPVQVIDNIMTFEDQEYHVAFLQDISERKRMEEALKESEQRLELALSGANEGIWDWRIKEDILYLDPRYYTMAGYLPNEFPCAYDEVLKRIHKDDLERTQSINDRYLAGELETFEMEFRFLRKDGSYMWIQAKGKIAAWDDHGNPARFSGTSTDITERKATEEELRQLRSYLSNIIDSMPSILVAVDRNGKVTQWNNQAEQATGMRFEEALGQSLGKVFPRLADEMERIMTSIQERRVISAPKVSRKMVWDTRFEDITIFPLVTNGVEGAVIRVDDVTDQVRMEELMIQSEKMLSVGGLAAGMAHEINNPLAGIMQTAEVMASRLGTNLYVAANEKAAEAAGTTMAAIEQFMKARDIQRMIDTITTSGQRVADIVDNMLSFARKSDAMASSQLLTELIDKTIELAATDYDLKKHYDFKLIDIQKKYAGDLPPVPCEGAKIQQVLLNIFRNGAQAMQLARTDNPRFVIRTWFEQDRGMAVIEIEDNGPGMEEAVRKRVFEPFFTNKPPGEGTGLGMSVSYFIITENHSGEMRVASRPGQGAIFTIRLPVKRSANG